jgi:hypothetical protein
MMEIFKKYKNIKSEKETYFYFKNIFKMIKEEKIKFEEFKTFFEENELSKNNELHVLVIELFNHECFELDKNTEGFLTSLYKNTLIPKNTWIERSHPNILEKLGVITVEDLEKKKIKYNTKTKLIYENFNLLYQETEGFSKLISEVYEIGSNTNQNSSVKNIKELIGSFNLEPNRTLDIILDSFEEYPNNDKFFELLNIFKPTNITKLLLFKLNHHKTNTPISLISLIAKLIKNKYVELKNIYNYVSDKNKLVITV